MDPTTLSEYCIYTIVELATLEEAAREGTPHTFNEGKPWVTGHALLEKARGAGLQMPVLLGDATIAVVSCIGACSRTLPLP